MTVNFRNSAGTDLDNLFYIANNNAGAIGFRASGGQDLGNRYPSGSLGYGVGYKNSAGTDIGYLRTKLATPTATISLSRTYYNNYVDDNDNGRYETTSIATVSITNSMPITGIDWYVESIYTVHTFMLNFNRSNHPNMYHGEDGWVYKNYDYMFNPRDGDGKKWIRSNKLFTNTSNSVTIKSHILNHYSIFKKCRLRAVVYAYNSLGGIWATSNEIWLDYKG